MLGDDAEHRQSSFQILEIDAASPGESTPTPGLGVELRSATVGIIYSRACQSFLLTNLLTNPHSIIIALRPPSQPAVAT